ncbi:MAG: putative transport system permease protein, partial [Frankiales bacterium]|nr:putative transport system permease protein [Frankiales bacterium]
GRLLATALGVTIAVALLASLGAFFAASKATMTQRAVQSVAVDWQVEVQPHGNAATVLAAARAASGTRAALPVGFAATTGLRATTAGTTQSTGPGYVLGLPPHYRATFPTVIRLLTGSASGVLVAQQTAANLHAAPGDKISIGRAGMKPYTVTVAGVVDLPQIDSLFQKVGAPPQSQRTAPPDNVVLLPDGPFHHAYGSVAKTRPDLVGTQIHVLRDHSLATDPSAAYTESITAANNLEAATSGAGVVGNNLAAALDSARSDALYSQILFLFLGVPGALLAAALSAAVADAGAVRRRREQALLRSRGVKRARLLRLVQAEAAVVGFIGSALGLGAAALIGWFNFGSASFGASTRSASIWGVTCFVIGVAIALAVMVIPARRDLRQGRVAAGFATVGRATRPRWMRYGIDAVLLVCSLAVFWSTSRSTYTLVLAPEGVPAISVDYWAFAGPALLWIAVALIVWRVSDLVLDRGRPVVSHALTPAIGNLAPVVASAMSRQRRVITRSAVLVGLALCFAISTATFNSTYRQQAEVDAQLTNGADVTVTESPGAAVSPAQAASLSKVPGVRAVEPLQHRFAYVGADLQDLYGINPKTITRATSLQDAYFQGASASTLLARLAARPDAILVSAETVNDYNLVLGDQLRLRLQSAQTRRYVPVTFHYVGIVNEFPTAPKDSFLIANASYITAKTGSNAVGAFLVNTGGTNTTTVAAAISKVVGTSAQPTTINNARNLVGSSLTSVDLSGLTRLELGFALVIAAAAGGLMTALGLTERRRTLAIAVALRATARQLRSFSLGESAFVAVVGLLSGAAAGWGLTHMLVKVLTGVFDPPPSRLAYPWLYLAIVAATAAAAIIGATLLTTHRARTLAQTHLREL